MFQHYPYHFFFWYYQSSRKDDLCQSNSPKRLFHSFYLSSQTGGEKNIQKLEYKHHSSAQNEISKMFTYSYALGRKSCSKFRRNSINEFLSIQIVFPSKPVPCMAVYHKHENSNHVKQNFYLLYTCLLRSMDNKGKILGHLSRFHNSNTSCFQFLSEIQESRILIELCPVNQNIVRYT